MPVDVECAVDGCTKCPYHRGWCSMHYSRWVRHGSIDNSRPSDTDRFWEGVRQPAVSTECWQWKKSLTTAGYGQFVWAGGTRRLAHRFAYELLVGPIPDRLQLDHLCRNRSCVNPAHLEPVTSRENVLRGISRVAVYAKATQCIHGHQFDEKNTRLRLGGGRTCRQCERERREASA